MVWGQRSRQAFRDQGLSDLRFTVWETVSLAQRERGRGGRRWLWTVGSPLPPVHLPHV